MEFLQLFPSALLELSYAMAPYILFGLLFAGVLHELVPESAVTKHLGKENTAAVLKATLFGIPLPVCSCGVIPLAGAIKKSGAGNGATLSFLISTPITGVDSILATYGMFGWAFTLYRMVTSMVIAVAAGILTNRFAPAVIEKAPAFSMTAPPSGTVGGFAAAPAAENAECCSESCGCETPEQRRFSLRAALRYGFVTLLGDIASPLFWGLIVGAVITVAIPSNLAVLLAEYDWLSYGIALAVAVPMYVCATASLPIAAGLMLAGVSAGAAFVFLSAGPATNTVTMGVVKKMLGTRALWIYLGTIMAGSVLFGLLLDGLFEGLGIDPAAMLHLHEEYGMLSMLSSAALWGLILTHLFAAFIKRRK